MNRSSFFIPDKALFGSYPSKEGLAELENMGVRCFIDLTCPDEKGLEKYTTQYTYINYPIIDRRCPTDWKGFANLIIRIGDIINNLSSGEKIYIHCKGGHGRSGILVACLLCYKYEMSPSNAISKTTKYHGRRKEMREKWRKIGSPQTRSQKHFVTKFFDPLFIYNNYTNYFSTHFSNEAEIDVKIPHIGKFPTAAAAFNAIKEPLNEEYIRKLKIVNKSESIKWDDVKVSVMYLILQHKFSQHTKISDYLMNTGLRPIIFQSNDLFWGQIDTKGYNVFGKLLCKLRNQYYRNYLAGWAIV